MMNLNKKIFLGGVLLTLACISFVSFQVSSASVTSQSSSFTRLTLTLISPKSTYVQLEPVPLAIGLVNNTNSAINYAAVLGFGPNLRILVRNDNNEEFELKGNDISQGIRLIVATPTTLSAGQGHQKQELVDRSFERLFPRPGRYVLRAVLLNERNERIISNPINIEISAPQGINLQAYNYIKATLEPAQQQLKPREMVQLQKYFVDNFGDSVYTKYKRVELASAYEAFGDNVKAEQELCKISAVNFHYSNQVQRALRRLNERLRPVALIQNLPENATLPTLPQPCTPLLPN